MAENNSSAPLKTAEGAALGLPEAGRMALTEYLQECDTHAITPDVGGAWAHAFRAGANYSAQALAAQAPAEVAEPDEREAFEQEFIAEKLRVMGLDEADPAVQAIRMCHLERYGNGDYPSLEAYFAWCAWQARAALAATPALPATEDSSAGDLAEADLSRISGGETPNPWSEAEKAGLSKALVTVFGHQAKVQEFLGIDMHTEGRDPVEMLDRIFEIYQRSMGKPAPDAEMAQVVATTKEMIFSWWAEHRELIRAALTAHQAEVQAEPVAWADWRVGSTSYDLHRTRERAEASVRQSELAAPQEGPYEVVPLYTAPQAQPADALDAARLMFVMQDADGFVNVEKDKYDFAIECAGEAGREEPTEADELNGVRRLLDAAMAAAQEGGNAAKEA